MSENKIIEEFLESTYDRNKNYNFICSKIKEKTGIKKKLLNSAAILLIVLVMGITAGGVYAMAKNIAYKEYQERNIISVTRALDEGSEGKYSEKIDMDYIYKDKIGIKITSFILTNDCLQFNLDIKLDKELEGNNKKMLNYAVAIYDEDNNIYFIKKRAIDKDNKDCYKKVYEELGVKNDLFLKHNSIANDMGFDISKITLLSDKGFPQSKKLYIKIFDIGYFDLYSSLGHVCLSESEWQFEINVPERFNDRTVLELIAKEEIEGIDINKVELAETNLFINLNINKFLTSDEELKIEEFKKLKNSAFYVSDGDGNIYRANKVITTRR